MPSVASTQQSQQSTRLLCRVQLIIHTQSLCFSVQWESHTPVDFFLVLQNCIFLAPSSNRVMYLLFTAVCKIQISFSLNVNVQRSCSSALNAMLTTCGTSGNASNCREESDISDTRDEPCA